MGYTYLDAAGAWTDPATSGRKHMRADGQWAAPDSDHRWLDATGAWSVPELRPTSLATASPAQLRAVAAEVAAGSSDYDSWLGAHTRSISFGSYGSSTFQLVAIDHDDSCVIGPTTTRPSPSRWPLVFMADTALGASRLSSGSTSYGWSALSEDNAARDYLAGLYAAMDADWAAATVRVSASIALVFQQSTGLFNGGVSSPANLFLPSEMNLGISEFLYSPDEGRMFGWFKSHNTDSERARRAQGGAGTDYMTRSGDRYNASSNSSFENMICISTTGTYKSSAVNAAVGIVPCFVIQG